MTYTELEIAATRRALARVRPTNRDELHGYLRAVLGLDVPRRPRIAGMTAPFEYLSHAFFEDDERLPRDCVVWANRGGGKTMLGAVATLLDLVFKPGVEIRILGGSLDQSTRMYRYLRDLLERYEFQDLLEGRITTRAIQLRNRSRVEILAQSERSVRGQRVHKLRCDEVELFTPEVWQAAQYVTRSGRCGGVEVRGGVEILSTMHLPFGLMSKLVDDRASRRQFRWSVIDVLEHCPDWRDCGDCPLWDDCRGAAKRGSGHFHIDDAIQQKRRSSTPSWAAEMLCERPSRSDSVYPEFTIESHVARFDRSGASGGHWIGGMDFGIRSPCVFLWAHASVDGSLWIVDEHVARDRTLDEHIEIVQSRPWPRTEWIGVDPAGHQRNEHTGLTNIKLLQRAGFNVRSRRIEVRDGVDAVRRFIRSSTGERRLRIDPRCVELIDALEKYHYDPGRPQSEDPVKDGPDHACDALRYLIVNFDRAAPPLRVRTY